MKRSLLFQRQAQLTYGGTGLGRARSVPAAYVPGESPTTLHRLDQENPGSKHLACVTAHCRRSARTHR
jgi:hypothetical protein